MKDSEGSLNDEGCLNRAQQPNMEDFGIFHQRETTWENR
jgi:hypothetical protein